MANFSCLFIVAICYLFANVNCSLPKFIKICHRSDPHVTKCIENSIYHLLPYLKDGIPEYNLPSIEPLQVSKVTLNGGTKTAPFLVYLSDIKTWNLPTAKLNVISANVTENAFRFKVFVPLLQIQGNYVVDTQILFLKIKGSGPFGINITNSNTECIIKGKLTKHKGVENLTFDRVSCQMRFDKANINLETVFDGNSVLTKVTNDLLNENVEIFYEELKPTLMESLEKIGSDIGNKVLKQFDYNEIFPI